ncbi:hypothetical protein KDD30_18590 (plasmid) [Photobacterium sp. GJ3]|uniref:hypothetical protein n=1 Tax=Photobacterium sp. GJ3 TaxID=2829502 RepID=UPI001B8DA79D|nr:hypothetical protein [Photobacterium sp. GJ3]QUJ70144.1 hypothetical protein KDD30_18590 [Photobacterium sp. GJ3]
MSHHFTHQCYQNIRDSIINDSTIATNEERLAEFMKIYCDIIKKENPLLAWERDKWEGGLRGIFAFVILCSVFISYAIYFFGDEHNKDVGMILGIGLISIISFLMLIVLYPERYQHKMTTTGIYIRFYRRGKKVRQRTIRFFLLISIPTVILLFLMMGPMAFAGAGAGALGVFSIAGVFREKDPVEMALPWEAIFCIYVNDEFGFFSSEKGFNIQFMLDLICDKSNFDQVKQILDAHTMNHLIYMRDYSVDLRSEEFNQLMDIGRKEVPFLVD